MQDAAEYRHFGAFRLLLAGLVVCQHFFANIAPLQLGALANPFALGGNAVLVFFSLSGFVIFEAADRVYPDKPRVFFINRLLRIVPQFLLATMLSIVLFAVLDAAGSLRVERDGVWIGSAAFALKNIAANLLGFLPLGDRFITYNFLPIAWALRVEMAFYVLVALALAFNLASPRLFRVRWSLERTGCAVAVLVAPLFGLSMLGKAPALFQFEPHFVYGCALYVAVTRRSRIASGIAALSVAGMLWQFFGQPSNDPRLGANVAGQFVLLSSLLGLMTFLAVARFRQLQRFDRAAGDLTYPLYMSHANVGLVFQSTTACDSYPILYAAFGASLVVALASRALIDPAVNRVRDAVRGFSLYEADAASKAREARDASSPEARPRRLQPAADA